MRDKTTRKKAVGGTGRGADRVRRPDCTKRKAYDDQALALALAHQTRPTGEIAREFGLTVNYVGKIRTGKSRPALQPLIQSIREGVDQGLEEWTRRHVRVLLERHIAVALKGRGSVARKCREYLLDKFLLDPLEV